MNMRGRRLLKGFTLTELAVVLVILGLLIGAVIRGTQLILQSKLRKQANDLERLGSAVVSYYELTGGLPGDRDEDGRFDGNESVWADLEEENLVDRGWRSPYGDEYRFAHGYCQGRRGNLIYVDLPSRAAGYADEKLDDGRYDWGSIRSYDDYQNYDGTMPLFYFITLEQGKISLQDDGRDFASYSVNQEVHR
jgi:prepilin-type N-terminal cleavage/methylation domain-containing protein